MLTTTGRYPDDISAEHMLLPRANNVTNPPFAYSREIHTQRKTSPLTPGLIKAAWYITARTGHTVNCCAPTPRRPWTLQQLLWNAQCIAVSSHTICCGRHKSLNWNDSSASLCHRTVLSNRNGRYFTAFLTVPCGFPRTRRLFGAGHLCRSWGTREGVALPRGGGDQRKRPGLLRGVRVFARIRRVAKILAYLVTNKQWN